MGSTIFDQGNSGDGDHFMEIKSSATTITISDMTIRDYDENSHGGAIDITSGGTITFQDVHFDNNSTTSSSDDGGAVYVNSSSTVTFDRCKFTNNSVPNQSTSEGSCIYSEGTLTVQNCLFYDNTCNYSSADGTSGDGHVYIDAGTATIVNCTFTENNAGSPLFLYDDSGTPTVVKNCLFYNNTSTNDITESITTSPYPTVSYTYYEARTGGFNTGSETGNVTSGNVDFNNSGSDDYTIKTTSVCKNAGTATGAPAKDFAENDRDATPDMGCYEFVLFSWNGTTNTDWSTASNWSTGLSLIHI